MFHNIEINRLRGIKHSKIEGLKQINLFSERITVASRHFWMPFFSYQVYLIRSCLLMLTSYATIVDWNLLI